MGLFDKLKNTFSGSDDTVKEVVSDKVETVTDAAKDLAEDAVEIVEEKKDSCCGGNCGS